MNFDETKKLDATRSRETFLADVIVIGGGAAGMFAAAVMAECAPETNILVIEKGSQPLAKVRRSGGGRCNLTHAGDDMRTFAGHYPRGEREMIGPLHRFGPRETMQWFESHGVPLVTLADGCLFPRSDTAADVVRALLETAGRGRTKIVCGAVATRLHFVSDAIEVEFGGNSRARADGVLVATGGGAYVEGTSHRLEPWVPSLFAFNTPDRDLTSLSGIVAKSVRLNGPAGLAAEGDLLIAHQGISGPAVLRLSSLGARSLAAMQYRFRMSIDWCPSRHRDRVGACLRSFGAEYSRRQLASCAPFRFSRRLWRLLAARAGIPASGRWSECSAAHLRALTEMVKAFPLDLDGKSSHREEFVTCGGVCLSEVDFRTMQSRLHPGLYLAGEALDIDGLTGGYNLQAAWTTGFLAAQSLRGGRPRSSKERE